jgi:Protein of unknown function (DUF998)
VADLLETARGAALGVAGPLIFLSGVILVSWSERDFMDELGWEHWPSGTALGPNGWATVLVFLLTGLCQMLFALSLLRQAGRSTVRRLGAGLLLLSGFGMAMLAFKTNHPDSDVNWHGSIHVAAYFTFFVGLLLAYVGLAWGSWKRLDRSSWLYAPLALLPWLGAFLLPEGLKQSNYMFFAVLFTPLLVLAIRVLATGGWPVAARGGPTTAEPAR